MDEHIGSLNKEGQVVLARGLALDGESKTARQ
jgi:hypothetical protein